MFGWMGYPHYAPYANRSPKDEFLDLNYDQKLDEINGVQMKEDVKGRQMTQLRNPNEVPREEMELLIKMNEGYKHVKSEKEVRETSKGRSTMAHIEKTETGGSKDLRGNATIRPNSGRNGRRTC